MAGLLKMGLLYLKSCSLFAFRGSINTVWDECTEGKITWPIQPRTLQYTQEVLLVGVDDFGCRTIVV